MVFAGRGYEVPDNLVSDALWERIAPLFPPQPERRHRHPGPLRVPDRVALARIVYVLCKGVAWRDVPAPIVGCSGVTAWRRLRDWTEARVWPRPHAVLLGELRKAGLLEMDDCAVDGSHVRSLKGGTMLDRRRSTEAVPAPSTMCSLTDAAPRSLSR
jgi:transposase